MTYQKIPVDKIYIDENLRITHSSKDKNLKLSIKKFNLKDPLKVIKKTNKYILISGYKRFDILKNDTDKIPCLVLDKKYSKCEILCYNIDDNLSTRNLTLYEKLNSLKKLKEFNCTESYNNYLKEFNIDPDLEKVKDLKIPSNLTLYLNNGDIDRKTAKLLLFFDNLSLKKINFLIKKNDFTRSEKRKLINMVLRAEEKNYNLIDLIDNLENKSKNKIFLHLNQIIFPLTNKLFNKYKTINKNFENIQVEKKPNFEDEDLIFKINFTSYEELRNKLENILKKIKNKHGPWYKN